MARADTERGVFEATEKTAFVNADTKKDLQKESSSWSRWWSVLGPGLLVCLADTDAGCLIVAGQSGSKWSYSLLGLQVLLIPILFLAQELTVRLGAHTRKGHTACIRERFGAFWAWFTCALLVISCIGAVVSEMSGVAAVAEIWGASKWVGTLAAAIVVIATVWFCNYRQVELVGCTVGLFELTFVISMFCLHPSPSKVLKGMFTFPSDSEFMKLVAANIGAVIMPWMIYFQQSAIVARKIVTGPEANQEKKHTLFGCIVTQLVMIGTLVTMAAAPKVGGNMEHVEDFLVALRPVMGDAWSKIFLSCAFLGGSISAAFVVSLAAAWAICEAGDMDDPFSLDRPPSEAPYFYGSYVTIVLLGAVVLLSGVNVIKLNVYIELMDALLMPMAIGFLYVLVTGKELPDQVRVKGVHKVVVAVLFSLVTIVALTTAFIGLVYGD
eukprot:gnl/TRDRNA2_/TRDRNA2_130330_c0_seq2.p1 gnl/TRDRNA2_/TRDRNA2_130330_c0~~gnl/TRDRNA2_/TRDRNA2_130330_c0_seq2.p1  ORF type:complete len:466 (+),score=85.30 gnl/TRDRNA2_/TRDRNA2_130330_c0_seq2:82-1398(+)